VAKPDAAEHLAWLVERLAGMEEDQQQQAAEDGQA